MKGSGLEIREEEIGGVIVVAPSGRIDAVTSNELERRLLALAATRELRLVVDMQAVEYVSSAGLRVLLRLARKVKEQSGRVVLCGLGPAVRQVFELAGFLPLFETEAERGLALARISGAGRA
jgi:anti-anti-sigma factor